MNTDDAEKTLQDQMDKPPGESKKYSMTKFGIYMILAVFAVSAAIYIIKPDTAGQIVVLANIVVTSIAGLVGIFCGAQATVDFRNSSSLASVVESKKNETRNVTVTETVEIIRAPKASHFDGEDVP